MIRITGWVLSTIFIFVLISLIYFGEQMPKGLLIVLIVSCSALIPFGFSLIVWSAKSSLPKRIYLLISIFLISAGLFSRFQHLPGAAIELIVGILWFCFAYSPIELRDKYLKWLPYSKNRFESLLLSTLDFAGITMFAIGIMFKLMSWPGANSVLAIGLLILLSALFTWNFKAKKEVVKRKESEDKIKEQFHEIQDSISYAKRIQSAILPPERLFKDFLKESFILYKPKDIVAGDFYWMEHVPDTGEVLFAACDCTGHGVPGAMVSVICNNALNRSVREYGLTEPGKILDRTREIVIAEFEKSDEVVKDGMDTSLCSLSLTKGNLSWAGANNPLWIIRKGATEVEEIKADKQPIGKFSESRPFSTHQVSINPGDAIYIFTDGYQDQFGGEKGKKFKASALKSLLLSIQDQTLEQQKKIIDKAFEDWRGKLEQVDDVCVIGVRY